MKRATSSSVSAAIALPSPIGSSAMMRLPAPRPALARPITVGRAEERRVEVLAGLEAGARVVLAPGGLASGAEVRVEG